MNTDFVAALEELHKELGIPLDELIRSVEQALADAYRRAFDPPGYVTVRIDGVVVLISNAPGLITARAASSIRLAVSAFKGQ